jgi:signal transduction histidine kinase
MPVSEFYFDNNERTFLLETVSKKGEVWDYEVRLKTKAGQVKYASLNAHLLFDSDGNQIGIEGSLRDIDERKHFEIELREAKVKAENADHLKTAFLHNISHEIRTPMNAIIGFSSLLCEPDISSESQSLFVDTIQESSNQLLSIINDIVDISSIEANLIKKHVTEFNLNAALKSLHNQFMLKASEKNISFGFKAGLTGKKAIILTDGTKVIQIMSNLLSNALKFTKQGQIDYGYTLKEDQVEFYVSDTGIGIPHEQHSKIFESFYQIENTLAREFGGTGLGLSICKAYSELLGGKLWLTSESEKGTTFFFSLPYRPVRPAAFQ